MPTSTTGSSNLFLQPTTPATNGVSDLSSRYSKFDKSNGYSSSSQGGTLNSSSYNNRYPSSGNSYKLSSTTAAASSRYRSGSLSGGSISALNNYDSTSSSALSSSRFGQRENNVESIKGAIKQQQQKHFTPKFTSTNPLKNGNNGSLTSILNGSSAKQKSKNEFLKNEYEIVRSQLVANKILEFENIASSASDLKNNNGYHHHQRPSNMNCLDDIKFIDSDEFAGPLPTRPKTSLQTKPSPSTLPLMSKKSAGATTASVIDANSIKASINKFNTLSEMKRTPTRSSTGNIGSSHHPRSHSHHHHHHSTTTTTYITNNNTSNNNNNYCGSSGSSSCSEKNYKSHSASPSSNTITSTTNNTTAAALKKQSSASPQSSRKASASSIFSTNATNLLKSTVICSASTKQSATTPTPTTTTSSQSPKLSEVKRSSENSSSKFIESDDSIRTTSIRTTLPPPSSPTSSSSRFLDSSASTSSYKPSRKTTNSESENSSINVKSANGDSDTSDEGLCGLRNIGNTCFMNSVIQCLSHTNELTKFLKSQTYIKNNTKDQQILYEFAKLIREMWTPNVGTVTPHELKSAFSTKHRMYSGYNQQDSQEFLRFFLDSLHCALNSGSKGEHLKIDDSWSDNRIADLTWEWYSRVENSIIKDLFVGQLKSTLKCTVCGNTSVTFDPFWDLSVPLPSSSRCKLDSCLDFFIREEILDGDEKPTCSKCQTRRKCTKSFTIQRFPRYLVIHLKRFSETRWSKLSNVVEFPTGEGDLNMAPYAATPTTNTYYTLYAVSNHMGSTAGGHYTAYCKHPYTKRWHEFNDNIVSEISESSVVSSSAYLLFYERTH